MRHGISRNWFQRTLPAGMLGVLLVACGTPSTGQQLVATPTPLPPDPALERPTYTVERGTIERVLEITGRVSPVDEQNLFFAREGRVAQVYVERDQQVNAGDVLAELEQEEAINALRDAEVELASAQRDLESAQRERELNLQARQEAVDKARQALARLLSGPEQEELEQAQDAVREAEQALEQVRTTGSEAKTEAEYQLVLATEAVQDAQKAYSEAYWDVDWVNRYGTDPNDPTIPDPNRPGRELPNYLEEEEKEAYRKALLDAERSLRSAERSLEQALRGVDQSRAEEISGIADAERNLERARRALDQLLTVDLNSPEIADAQSALRQAELQLQAELERTFDSQLNAVDRAQRNLESARRKIEQGQIVAAQAGVVLVVNLSVGDEVQPYDPIITVADPSQLEISTELSGTQMRELVEGQPALITRVARPDIEMPAIIRRLPAPYGSGGSGTVRDPDPTTRLTVTDTLGQQLEAGDVVRIRIVLEARENVLILPVEAIRKFEGRVLVNVIEAGRERRVPVTLGIETEDRVEVVEGLEEGMTVVVP